MFNIMLMYSLAIVLLFTSGELFVAVDLVNVHIPHGHMDVVGAAVGGEFAVVEDPSESDQTNWVIDGMVVPVGGVLRGALSGVHYYYLPAHMSYYLHHDLQYVVRLDGTDDGGAVVDALVCCVDLCSIRNAWADGQMHRPLNPFLRHVESGLHLHCYCYGRDGDAVSKNISKCIITIA